MYKLYSNLDNGYAPGSRQPLLWRFRTFINASANDFGKDSLDLVLRASVSGSSSNFLDFFACKVNGGSFEQGQYRERTKSREVEGSVLVQGCEEVTEVSVGQRASRGLMAYFQGFVVVCGVLFCLI